PISRQRSLRPNSAMSSIGIPVANAPPTIDPADVPATQSIRMPCSSSARKTPTWAMPRAAPPESANPIFMKTKPDSVSQSPLVLSPDRETHPYQTQSSPPSTSSQSRREPAPASARFVPVNGPERVAYKRLGSNLQSPSD